MTACTEMTRVGSPEIALTLLGTFSLTVGGTPVQISARKGQLLLARLATDRTKTMSRARMASFLWPDHGASQSRASLRQALSRLRDVLGDAGAALGSDTESVWLSSDVRVDTEQLSADLPVAALCAQGVFLEGIQVPEPGLQEWLETERRHQTERLSTALADSAETAERDGRTDDLVRLGLHQVTLDPLNENAHRQLMRAFADSRRAARAMEQYHTLVALLRAELNVAPEKATTDLYHQIRNSRVRANIVDPTSEPPSDETPEAFPELRLVTVLCIRAEPSVRQRLITEIKRFSGEVSQVSGPNLTVFFGLSVSHEDDALRALEAVKAAQSILPDLAAGLAIGLVKLASEGLQGEALRRAEAISFIAAPGEILAGPSMRNHTQRWADYEQENIRGQTFWRLTRLKLGPVRPRLPLVGRKMELLQLCHLQDDAAEGNGSVAILSGNSGLGKTRLSEELEARVSDLDGQFLRIAFSPTTGQQVSLEFRFGRGLAEALGVSCPEDVPNTNRRSYAFACEMFADAPDATRFSGYDPKVRADIAIQVVLGLLTSAKTNPTTIVFEDCHWATDEEIGFLAQLAPRLFDLSVFVLATERASTEKLRPALQARSMETPLTVLTLSPLRSSEARKLAQTVMGDDLDDEAKIVTHAAGNPLFIIRLAEAHDTLGEALPPSVIALAQHQLDQVDAATRRNCQDIAVLGPRAQRADVSGIFGAETIAEALASGFLNARGSEVEFNHALIHQAIYEATPKGQRRSAHTRAAAYFQRRDVFKWADHALASGDSTAAATACINAAKAAVAQNRFALAERLVIAGLSTGCASQDRAELTICNADIHRDKGQIEQAITLYAEAADTTNAPDPKLRALVGQAWMLRFRGAKDDADTAFRQAESLFESNEVSDISRCDFLAERGNRAFVRGDSDAARTAHAQALEVAQKGGHLVQTARALGGLGDAHYAAFRLISARDRYRQCVDFADAHGLGMIANAHRHMVAYTSFFVEPGETALALAHSAIDHSMLEGNARNEFAARVDLLDYLALNLDFEAFDTQLEKIETLIETIGENRFQSDMDGAKCVRALLSGDLGTLRKISDSHLNQPPSPYIWPAIAALRACASTNPQDRDNWLTRGEAQLRDAPISHAMLLFYHFAACAVRDEPERATSYAATLRERSATELCAFAALSIRATSLQAETSPREDEMSTLRTDLAKAHLRGIWPELFVNQG